MNELIGIIVLFIIMSVLGKILPKLGEIIFKFIGSLFKFLWDSLLFLTRKLIDILAFIIGIMLIPVNWVAQYIYPLIKSPEWLIIGFIFAIIAIFFSRDIARSSSITISIQDLTTNAGELTLQSPIFTPSSSQEFTGVRFLNGILRTINLIVYGIIAIPVALAALWEHLKNTIEDVFKGLAIFVIGISLLCSTSYSIQEAFQVASESVNSTPVPQATSTPIPLSDNFIIQPNRVVP